jgi:uncharacterized protein
MRVLLEMSTDLVQVVAAELKLKPSRVQAAVDLLADGATVPFIARYRKEATGSLDEVAIRQIRDRLLQLQELEQRKQVILSSLSRNGHLTDALQKSVLSAATMSALEDFYLPYRPKRKTRAVLARQRGLEPLAERIFEQSGIEPRAEAAAFVQSAGEVPDVETALAGARDILAERISEHARARARLRDLYARKAVLRSRVSAGKEKTGHKFRDYFDWQEPLADVPSHRMLAMRRGEAEEVLMLSIAPPEAEALRILDELFVHGTREDSHQVRMALKDAYKRLLSRSLETEFRLASRRAAEAEAIAVFAENLQQLLLAAPLGAKSVMGVDPGYRTGCKLACLDRQGKLVHHTTIYPHSAGAAAQEAGRTVERLCERFAVEAIAVGNGTAGRETETFIRSLPFKAQIPVVMVDESGASVYSASESAREEFPDLDVAVRGAISIGRRLMDPLAELVKIDPKSIGIGQYQHDVNPADLKKALDEVVISCVNRVGVDLNRASFQLLGYVSGVGPQLARNIVAYRDLKGPFRSRSELRRVPRLGEKAFEQAAGFLRIHDGTEPLDVSAVHPESYPVVEAMAADLGCSVRHLMADAKIRRRIDPSRYITERVGMPTLQDIMMELSKPGRDPRENFEPFAFSSRVRCIEDLEPGMQLPGIVTNVTAFGAFVDIGIHQDGLVHISELADRFVKRPGDVVKVRQIVQVTVLGIDLERRRVSLSMRQQPKPNGRQTHAGSDSAGQPR